MANESESGMHTRPNMIAIPTLIRSSAQKEMIWNMRVVRLSNVAILRNGGKEKILMPQDIMAGGSGISKKGRRGVAPYFENTNTARESGSGGVEVSAAGFDNGRADRTDLWTCIRHRCDAR